MERIILAPLDGSELAETALPHAAQLARATGSELTLLRALEPSLFTSITNEALGAGLDCSREDQLREANNYLSAIAQKWGSPDLTIHTVLSEQTAASAIIDYVKQHAEVETICMATHGRSGPNRLLFGSVAEKTLHGVTVPMLLIRPTQEQIFEYQPPLQPYDSIVVTLDGSPLAEQALGPALKVARATGAQVDLVSILPEPSAAGDSATQIKDNDERVARLQDYLATVADQLGDEDLTVSTWVARGPIADTIQRIGERASMIVMATHGRSGLQRLRFGSVALTVLRGVHKPVLVVKAQPTTN